MAAVVGAYFVLYPSSRVLTLMIVFLVRIPAWVFRGVWFLYQLVEGDFGLLSASANGGGVAFFATSAASCSATSWPGSLPGSGPSAHTRGGWPSGPHRLGPGAERAQDRR